MKQILSDCAALGYLHQVASGTSASRLPRAPRTGACPGVCTVCWGIWQPGSWGEQSWRVKSNQNWLQSWIAVVQLTNKPTIMANIYGIYGLRGFQFWNLITCPCSDRTFQQGGQTMQHPCHWINVCTLDSTAAINFRWTSFENGSPLCLPPWKVL